MGSNSAEPKLFGRALALILSIGLGITAVVLVFTAVAVIPAAICALLSLFIGVYGLCIYSAVITGDSYPYFSSRAAEIDLVLMDLWPPPSVAKGNPPPAQTVAPPPPFNSSSGGSGRKSPRDSSALIEAGEKKNKRSFGHATVLPYSGGLSYHFTEVLDGAVTPAMQAVLDKVKELAGNSKYSGLVKALRNGDEGNYRTFIKPMRTRGGGAAADDLSTKVGAIHIMVAMVVDHEGIRLGSSPLQMRAKAIIKRKLLKLHIPTARVWKVAGDWAFYRGGYHGGHYLETAAACYSKAMRCPLSVPTVWGHPVPGSDVVTGSDDPTAPLTQSEVFALHANLTRCQALGVTLKASKDSGADGQDPLASVQTAGFLSMATVLVAPTTVFRDNLENLMGRFAPHPVTEFLRGDVSMEFAIRGHNTVGSRTRNAVEKNHREALAAYSKGLEMCQATGVQDIVLPAEARVGTAKAGAPQSKRLVKKPH